MGRFIQIRGERGKYIIPEKEMEAARERYLNGVQDGDLIIQERHFGKIIPLEKPIRS